MGLFVRRARVLARWSARSGSGSGSGSGSLGQLRRCGCEPVLASPYRPSFAMASRRCSTATTTATATAESRGVPQKHNQKPRRRKASGSGRPRGMVDVGGDDCADFAWVEQQAARVARLHGFMEVRTPVVEFASTYTGALGGGSDVVNKEMYGFEDRSGHLLTLRPEGTAGFARALLSWTGPPHALQRAFYCGPMFRYERPQRGRQRQFTQFGAELVDHGGPSADVELLLMAHRFLASVGLQDSCTLLLNSLGDKAARADHGAKLLEYLMPHRAALSPDSQARLDSGRVLRILDSKSPADAPFVAGAPRIADSLGVAARDRFEAVRQGLDDAGVRYVVDPLLVRGLDYYTHTIFEFVQAPDTAATAATAATADTAGSGGKQEAAGRVAALRPSALLAGGRYEGLAAKLGHGTPRDAFLGVGWAAGIERLVLERQRLGLGTSAWPSGAVFVAPLLEQRGIGLGCDAAARVDDDAVDAANADIKRRASALVSALRDRGVPVHVWLDMLDADAATASAVKKAFKRAEKRKAAFIAFVGASELAQSQSHATVKHLESGEQIMAADPQQVVEFLARCSQS